MIKIKLSQYCLYHLVNLTDEQIKEIEAAREKATRFVVAGTKKQPIVDFYVENDCLKTKNTTQCAFGEHYDGKGFKVSYGLLPKNKYDRFPVVHLTSTMVNEKYLSKTVVPELEPLAIEQFNALGSNAIKFALMDYEEPFVDATHMIVLDNVRSLAANFPLDIWQVALPLHYFCNEINSNRKWKDPEEEDCTYDVIRFWNDETQALEYYADIYEHCPDDALNLSQRNFLLKKIDEKDVFFKG